MKVLFLIALLFLFPTRPAPSLSFSVCSDGTVGIKDDGIIINVSPDEFSLELPLFSFGAMEKGGIISSFDHPFSSASLSSSFSSAGSGSRTVGSCVSYGGFSLFSFYGERDGAGVLYEGENWKAGVVYASPQEDRDYQKNIHLRLDCRTLWAVGEYEGQLISARVMSSVTEKGSFNSLIRISLRLSCITFSFGRGKLQAFSLDADGWDRELSCKISNDFFSVSHSLRYAPDPVYLREYRDYEYRIRGSLKAGDFSFSDSVTKTFTDGRTKRSEKLEFSWKEVSLAWKRESGSFLLSISRDGASVEWEKGKLSVSIERSIMNSKGSFTFFLSSSGKSGWFYTYTC